jgi:hypothetical protein
MAIAGEKRSGRGNQRGVYKVPEPSHKQIIKRADSGDDQAKDVAKESSQNWDVMLQSGSVLADGLQDISREWVSVARNTIEMNIDGWSDLLRSRNVQEFISAQNSLMRRNVETMLSESARMGELSMGLVNAAVQTVGGKPSPTTDQAA